MNENTTYRTPLYGVDALAVVEYGVRGAVVGTGCGFRHAWLETDGRVCFMTNKPTDENILGLAGGFLLGMASSLKLVNAKSAQFFVNGRNFTYGPGAFEFVGAALSNSREIPDMSKVIAELGQLRVEAMTSPMNPIEVELALNFDTEYENLLKATETEIKSAVDKYKKAWNEARLEYDSKTVLLCDEKNAEINAIKSRAADKAAALAKELGVDVARHPFPVNSGLSIALAAPL